MSLFKGDTTNEKNCRFSTDDGDGSPCGYELLARVGVFANQSATGRDLQLGVGLSGVFGGRRGVLVRET